MKPKTFSQIFTELKNTKVKAKSHRVDPNRPSNDIDMETFLNNFKLHEAAYTRILKIIKGKSSEEIANKMIDRDASTKLRTEILLPIKEKIQKNNAPGFPLSVFNEILSDIDYYQISMHQNYLDLCFSQENAIEYASEDVSVQIYSQIYDIVKITDEKKPGKKKEHKRLILNRKFPEGFEEKIDTIRLSCFNSENSHLLIIYDKANEELKKINEKTPEIFYENIFKLISKILLSRSEVENMPVSIIELLTKFYEKLSTSAFNNKSKVDYISRLITHNIKDEPKLFKAISSIIRDCFSSIDPPTLGFIIEKFDNKRSFIKHLAESLLEKPDHFRNLSAIAPITGFIVILNRYRRIGPGNFNQYCNGLIELVFMKISEQDMLALSELYVDSKKYTGIIERLEYLSNLHEESSEKRYFALFLKQFFDVLHKKNDLKYLPVIKSILTTYFSHTVYDFFIDDVFFRINDQQMRELSALKSSSKKSDQKEFKQIIEHLKFFSSKHSKCEEKKYFTQFLAQFLNFLQQKHDNRISVTVSEEERHLRIHVHVGNKTVKTWSEKSLFGTVFPLSLISISEQPTTIQYIMICKNLKKAFSSFSIPKREISNLRTWREERKINEIEGWNKHKSLHSKKLIDTVYSCYPELKILTKKQPTNNELWRVYELLLSTRQNTDKKDHFLWSFLHSIQVLIEQGSIAFHPMFSVFANAHKLMQLESIHPKHYHHALIHSGYPISAYRHNDLPHTPIFNPEKSIYHRHSLFHRTNKLKFLSQTSLSFTQVNQIKTIYCGIRDYFAEKHPGMQNDFFIMGSTPLAHILKNFRQGDVDLLLNLNGNRSNKSHNKSKTGDKLNSDTKKGIFDGLTEYFRNNTTLSLTNAFCSPHFLHWDFKNDVELTLRFNSNKSIDILKCSQLVRWQLHCDEKDPNQLKIDWIYKGKKQDNFFFTSNLHEELKSIEIKTDVIAENFPDQWQTAKEMFVAQYNQTEAKLYYYLHVAKNRFIHSLLFRKFVERAKKYAVNLTRAFNQYSILSKGVLQLIEAMQDYPAPRKPDSIHTQPISSKSLARNQAIFKTIELDEKVSYNTREPLSSMMKGSEKTDS